MNVHRPLIATLLPLVSFAALAADPADSNSVSRASVKASVVSARAAHQLIPAGDAADFYVRKDASTSTLTRAEVKQEVRQARLDGLLQPAGEAESYTVAQGPLTWDHSRAEVKADVLEARARGELIPAGEGERAGVETTASGTQSFHRLAGVFRKLRTAE